MIKNPICKKQEEYLRASDKRINILSGSVRSGKTYISLIKWALFVGSCPENYEFIMCGKTVTSLKRNCLNLLVDLVGSQHFTYSLSQKSASLFGRTVWLEGANDERSESKIRGMTLGGAYCDEITLFPQGFFVMLLSRLSQTGAKLFATTNPDNPNHWVKKEVIDNPKLDMMNWHFVIDDNDFLDPEYVSNLKSEYTGVWYRRYILGEWCLANGAIYDMFDESIHIKEDSTPFNRSLVACDYGTQNPCVFGLFRDRSKARVPSYHLEREYYYKGKSDRNDQQARQKTDAEYAADLKTFVGNDKVDTIIVDPSAASFIAQLRKDGWRVIPARNNVIDGIRKTATMLEAKQITVDPSCKETIKEFSAYVWDEKAADRGEDKPIKQNDHCMDMLRYAIFTDMRPKARVVNVNGIW